MGKSYKGKIHACIFTVHLVKGVESDRNTEHNERILVMKPEEQRR